MSLAKRTRYLALEASRPTYFYGKIYSALIVYITVTLLIVTKCVNIDMYDSFHNALTFNIGDSALSINAVRTNRFLWTRMCMRDERHLYNDLYIALVIYRCHFFVYCELHGIVIILITVP